MNLQENPDNVKSCPKCNGKGKIETNGKKDMCPKCKSSGLVLKKKIKIKELIEGKYGSLKVASPSRQAGHNAGARRGGSQPEEKKRLEPSQIANLKKDAKDFNWKKGTHLKHLHPDDQEKVFEGFDSNEFKGKKDKLVSTPHKVGDEVMCDAGMGSTKYGKVHRLGRTMVHVKHNDGTISAYAAEHVEKYSKTYWQDKQGK